MNALHGAATVRRGMVASAVGLFIGGCCQLVPRCTRGQPSRNTATSTSYPLFALPSRSACAALRRWMPSGRTLWRRRRAQRPSGAPSSATSPAGRRGRATDSACTHLESHPWGWVQSSGQYGLRAARLPVAAPCSAGLLRTAAMYSNPIPPRTSVPPRNRPTCRAKFERSQLRATLRWAWRYRVHFTLCFMLGAFRALTGAPCLGAAHREPAVVEELCCFDAVLAFTWRMFLLGAPDCVLGSAPLAACLRCCCTAPL